MDFIEGIVLGPKLSDSTECQQRYNADDRSKHGGWFALRLEPVEESFHLVAPGNEGDIIAKPPTNCRGTVKLRSFGISAARSAGRRAFLQ
jgi:hypothetical protein